MVFWRVHPPITPPLLFGERKTCDMAQNKSHSRRKHFAGIRQILLIDPPPLFDINSVWSVSLALLCFPGVFWTLESRVDALSLSLFRWFSAIVSAGFAYARNKNNWEKVGRDFRGKQIDPHLLHKVTFMREDYESWNWIFPSRAQ
jgi:hypothetical protein